MKSIVYILIAILLGSSLVSALPKSKFKNTQTVKIQCVDINPSQDLLNKSVDIIKSRLDIYGLQDAIVTQDGTSQSIDISIAGKVDSESLTSLLTSKGKVEFYETYDRLEVIKDLGIDERLASILNIPTDAKEINRSSGIYGYCKEAKKSEVELYIKNNYVSKHGNGINFYWSELTNGNGDFYLYLLKHKASLDNSYIAETVVRSELSNEKPELMITFNNSGKSIWNDITKRNIGKSIAIVLDQKVLQAPMVVSEITEGKCIISGNFSMNEISRINSFMNNTALPLEFKMLN